MHGSESWAPSAPDLQCLRPNYRAMVSMNLWRETHDEIPMNTLYAKLGIQEIAALRTCHLMYLLGHGYGKLQRKICFV